MLVFSQGTVTRGEDLADAPGHVVLCPTSGGRAVMLDFPAVTSMVASYEIEGAGKGTMTWDEKHSRSELDRVLHDAGYSMSMPEIEETIGAIGGVMMGPKGTKMRGQTHVLTVKTIDFDTMKRAPVFADCR